MQDMEHEAELDAIFDGRYVEFLTAARRPVPVWARVNRVAHAALADLEKVVGSHRPTDPAQEQWWAAEFAITGEVLWVCGGQPEALAELQANTLFPLEMALAGDVEAAGWTAGQYRCEVQAAIHHHPSSRFRSSL